MTEHDEGSDEWDGSQAATPRGCFGYHLLRTGGNPLGPIPLPAPSLGLCVVSQLHDDPGWLGPYSLGFYPHPASFPASLILLLAGPGQGPSSTAVPSKYFSTLGDQWCIIDGKLDVNHPGFPVTPEINVHTLGL